MLAIGDVLNKRYKILKYISSGGTATVYLGRDLILDRQVAIKVLRYDFSQDEKNLKRFQREARAISSLNHPNIVELYDVDEDDQSQYLVMEYVDGMDLKRYIDLHKPVTVTEIVQIMLQVVDAVEQAHVQGIIHRDLKTQNILIRRDKVIKITDFGIATGFLDTLVTQTNTLVGSIHYLSPEQARGQKATVQSDIYALGIILYELIMGHVPFTGTTAVSIAMKHFQTPIPSIIDNARQTVPQSLENIVLRATAKNPQNRYATAQEMYDDLKTCLRLDRQAQVKYKEPLSNAQTMTKPLSSKTGAKSITARPVLQQATPLSAKKKTTSKKKKIAIFSTIGVCLVALLVLFWLFQKPKVSVPNIVGQTQTEATETLSRAGLIVGTIVEEESETIAKGLVIRSTPEVNATVAKQSAITLVISSGNASVVLADYTNQDYGTVYPTLVNKGFIVERRVVNHASVPSGYIVEQSIKAGTKVVPKGTVITLSVSDGAIKLKDYTNQNVQGAKSELESLGFNVQVNEVDNSEIEAGKVIAQSIPAQTAIDTSQTKSITLTVSKGITMPNFVGWNRQAVDNRVRELGLTVNYQYVHSATIAENTVINQSVQAGKSVSRSTAIVITISLGKKEVPVTTTTTPSTTKGTEETTSR